MPYTRGERRRGDKKRNNNNNNKHEKQTNKRITLDGIVTCLNKS